MKLKRNRRVRITIVGVLAAALAAVFLWRVGEEARAVEDLIALQQEQILQLERTLASRTVLEQENLRLRRSLEEGEKALLLEGDTPDAAAAALQSFFTKKASESGMQIRNVRTLTPRSEGGYRPVQLHVALETDLESLLHLPALLQEYGGLLHVSSADVSARNQENYQTLSVRLVLAGWSLPFEPPKAKERSRNGG
jgi:type II secretory pathway pseudopilin PulG